MKRSLTCEKLFEKFCFKLIEVVETLLIFTRNCRLYVSLFAFLFPLSWFRDRMLNVTTLSIFMMVALRPLGLIVAIYRSESRIVLSVDHLHKDAQNHKTVHTPITKTPSQPKPIHIHIQPNVHKTMMNITTILPTNETTNHFVSCLFHFLTFVLWNTTSSISSNE